VRQRVRSLKGARGGVPWSGLVRSGLIDPGGRSKRQPSASFVAAPGTTTRRTCGRRTGTTTSRQTGTTTWAFAVPSSRRSGIAPS
jgi:hypothetical protein